jgi:hypothetical protein
VNEKLDLVSEGFGLTKTQRQLIVRVGWVVAVTLTGAYMLGAFSLIGLSGPFVFASDYKQLESKVAQIERTTSASAKVTLAQEIRIQVRAKCLVTDTDVRESIQRVIDQLQDDYAQLAGQRYPEGACP